MNAVFFDVDTQIDFLYPAGALYLPGAERIEPALARLTAYAGDNRIPVISTMDAHTESDPEFRDWPPHCVAGTLGQRKPAATSLDNQIIIEKQHLNCFTNPNLKNVLSGLAAERYVVYGVVTEYCVRFAVEGLLKTGCRVEIVTDAIQTLKAQDGAQALDDLVSAGARLTTVAEVRG